MPVRTGGRIGWHGAAAALLVLLTLIAVNRSAWADDADPFAAKVTVDATAENVVKAREAARIDGQRRALTAIAERLAGANTPVKMPKLDDKAISDLVVSFEVANEKMSAVRYIAEYTFHFQPDGVRRVLHNAGITLAGEPGKQDSGKPEPGKDETARRLVLLPVYQSGGQPRLWDEPNPWRDAWEHLPDGPAAARIVVPLGDAGDVAAIDADKALAGNVDALAAVARRNGAEDAVVALAALRGPADKPIGLDVTLRRYQTGKLTDTRANSLVANPGENADDFLRRAAAAIISDIDSGWKKEPAGRYDQEGTLTAVLPISGLDDWVHARERLAGAPAVRKIALVALSRQEAAIEIGYSGNIDQLKAALAAIGFDLAHGDATWRLTRVGAAHAP